MDVGIEIGGTKLQVATGDPSTGKFDQIYRYQVDKALEAEGILAQIEKTLLALPYPPTRIGIGFGGPVNRTTGVIAASHQIGGWSGFELLQWFKHRFDVPVFMDNDANLAALGEAHFGAGKGYKQVFYITLGSGVGGGLVCNGALYHGNAPGEAEVGLLQLDRQGNNLESFCSGWALDAKIRKLLPALPNESALKQLVGFQQSGEAKFVLPALNQSDRHAAELLSEYADTLAWGLSHVVHLFNPQIIVLGGGVSLIGEALRVQVQEALPKYLVKAFQPGPLIALAELKEETVLVGALCLLNQ